MKVFDILDSNLSQEIKYFLLYEQFFKAQENDIEFCEFIVEKILDYLFENKTSSTKPTMNYKKDYRLIWDSFLSKRGIDLNKVDINWWEFNSILEGLMLEGGSPIVKVVEYRTMKMPKSTKYNKEEIDFYKKMKQEYALTSDASTSQANSSLTSFLKVKVGERKNG